MHDHFLLVLREERHETQGQCDSPNSSKEGRGGAPQSGMLCVAAC